MKVLDVTTTSSPGPISKALKAASSASVPFAIAIAYLLSDQLAKAASNSRQIFPVQ
jgi:hypothetical protein